MSSLFYDLWLLFTILFSVLSSITWVYLPEFLQLILEPQKLLYIYFFTVTLPKTRQQMCKIFTFSHLSDSNLTKKTHKTLLHIKHIVIIIQRLYYFPEGWIFFLFLFILFHKTKHWLRNYITTRMDHKIISSHIEGFW